MRTVPGNRLSRDRTAASHAHATVPAMTWSTTRAASLRTNQYASVTGHRRDDGVNGSNTRYPAVSGNRAGVRPHTAAARTARWASASTGRRVKLSRRGTHGGYFGGSCTNVSVYRDRMKSLMIHELGSLDSLAVEDRPSPSLSDGQIRVKVAA